jgi:uncharacterized protein (TIGR03435 family)
VRPSIIATILAAAAFGQPAARLEFEVASVKPAGPPALAGGQRTAGVKIDGAQVHCTYLSIRDYIRAAYKVKDYQIEGPPFMASERFDIDAKLPSGGTREQVADMFQSLLADRFGMAMHRETKEFPVYGLIVDKGGIKAKESALEADPGTTFVTSTSSASGTFLDFGKGASCVIGDHTFTATKLSMAYLADMLARFTEIPVVDMTGLKSTYDFTLEFKPEEFLAMKIRAAVIAGVTLPPDALKLLDNATDDSLYAALAKQGLKLDRRKAPLEVLVIDRVEKMPTSN